MSKVIRVLICDDHDMLREGLVAFLKLNKDLELVGEATTGLEAVRICQEESPDVVLMDLVMPEMDGVEAIKLIHQSQPNIRIIALSSFAENKLVRSAIDAGASSYLLKNVSAETLSESIRVASSGFAMFSPEITQGLLVPEPNENFIQLTNRETEVLSHMIEGYSNAEIAYRLGISKFTVKNHVSSILGKLGASSRTEAVRIALQNDLV